MEPSHVVEMAEKFLYATISHDVTTSKLANIYCTLDLVKAIQLRNKSSILKMSLSDLWWVEMAIA